MLTHTTPTIEKKNLYLLVWTFNLICPLTNQDWEHNTAMVLSWKVWRRLRVCGVEDTELLLVLEGEVEFDEERVIQVGHHVPLSLHVLRLVLLHDVALLQDLNWTGTHTHFQLKGANIYECTYTVILAWSGKRKTVPMRFFFFGGTGYSRQHATVKMALEGWGLNFS